MLGINVGTNVWFDVKCDILPLKKKVKLGLGRIHIWQDIEEANFLHKIVFYFVKIKLNLEN